MAEKLFYSMGELAEMFDVKTSLIRHWDSQFSILKPKRNKKGNRLFSPQDVENLKVIYHLVKERGMTLEGARKALKRRAAGGSGDPIKRDAELMTRLRHIRALLVEVREDLKTGSEGVVADEEPTADPVFPADAVAEPAVSAEPATPAEPAVSSEPAVSTDGAPTSAAPAALATPAAPAALATPAAPAALATPAAPAALATPAAPAAPAVSTDKAAAPAAPQPALRRKAVVKIEPETSAEDPASASAEAPAGQKPRAPRRPRRKAGEDENKELFAFYEQSLF